MKPDAFLTDAYGYATNQMGHFFLGVALLAALVSMSDFVTDRPWRWGGLALALGYSAHEIVNVIDGGLLWDSVEDAAFVGVGAAFCWAAWHHGRRTMQIIVAGVSAALAAGSFVRWRK